MEYKPDKIKIAKRIAHIFEDGSLVNLGIGLPTLVANYIPNDIDILLQSENGFVGLGPEPEEGKLNPDIVNAGGSPVTILKGGCFFDSAQSFGIIRGGHLDYTVLGVLEVDQKGNLANYMIPGKMVESCTLPLTAKGEVDYIVTDTGLFEIGGDCFILKEYFAPAAPEWIQEKTNAKVIIAPDCREYIFQ